MTHHPPKHATHDGDEYAKEALQVAESIALQEQEREGVHCSNETALPEGNPRGRPSHIHVLGTAIAMYMYSHVHVHVQLLA